MYTAEPKIVPLGSNGKIFAILDERGKIAGTGTQEVCEVMIYILRQLQATNTPSKSKWLNEPRRPNLHAVIPI